MARDTSLTGKEQFFKENELIVSKTNLKGHITYCNQVFLKISGYSEKEILGQPHSVIRHPEMPRCVFDILWETVQNGHEIFAYVVNRCKNGDHYWVNAHVTPSRDKTGSIIGYHSNRRVPDRDILEKSILPLYQKLNDTERSHTNRKTGMQASRQLLDDTLQSQGMRYDEFIARL
ncbi:PAS domain-containing protein [Cohaesibacter celericrescens]|uniref:Chemotaxis protein n=1 Tax=Cohaesibacter celericrescens TaxID=2067669 RepID=A0A2N5XU25_9HYPH|nr:PAS domain-containing protein [Cohaesibacter celericrescens]PLW78013.1 chemotaxis protein [Cohaesibacter celericrescens]